MSENWSKAIVYADLIDGIKHGTFVSNLTYMIAKELGFDDNECYNMAFAGMIHDIGKLRLSSFLYGRNTNSMEIEEMRQMRKHPLMGYEALKGYDIPESVKRAVLYHHESFDGSGYPYNLKGNDIPVAARVLKVADSFVALVSERPYREAYDIDTAIGIMIEDIHVYDLKVFLAFMKVVHDEEVLADIQDGSLCLDIDFGDLYESEMIL